MNFWLHKINPGQTNETNCFNVLTKLNLLATGYSDMAEVFIYDPNDKEQSIAKAMDKKYPDWNYNHVTRNNLLNFIYEMKKGDIVIIPLTKEYNNEIYIYKVISEKVINVQNGEIPQIASDIGFLHLAEFIKKFEFNDVSEELRNFIEENKGKNTTIKINSIDVINLI